MRRVAIACLLAAASTIAHAQNTDLTKEFQAGIDAFRLGKYDEARAHLEKARDIDPKLPGPYRFLAAVAQAQGKWDDCIANARKALELNPQSSETADTRKLHDECRTAAGRTPYRGELADSAAIAVTTNVAGASVKINGLGYGATPLAPRPITAGELEVEIEKQGWKPAKTTINGLAGIVTDVIIDLEPDPNATTTELHVDNEGKIDKGWLVVKRPTGPGACVLDDKLGPPVIGRLEMTTSIDGGVVKSDVDPKEAGALRYELSPGVHVVEVRTDTSDSWTRRVRISAGQKTVIQPELILEDARAAVEKRGLYIVGAGGALLVGGFVTSMISRDAADEARDIQRIETQRDPSQPLSVTGQISPVRTRADFDAAIDRAHTFAIISDVAYGAGLVAAGVGAYYLYKGARERTDVPPPFAIAPTHGGVYVAKEIAW